jgi:hypothetical protein
MASEHFRFLDLPAELRLMVYEHLEIETRLHTIEDRCLGPMGTCAAITIEIKSVPGWDITFEALERKVGMVVTGVELYDFPEDLDLDMPCQILQEAEWTELWAHEQVIGFD